MIKVTALTSGKNVPSSRFRVRQFIEPLARLGIKVCEYPLAIKKYTPNAPPPVGTLGDALKALARLPGLLASRRSDITWLERELVPRRRSLERYAGTKRVFDVDDAIWLTAGSEYSEEVALTSDGVIAGNQFLANHYQQAGARVWLVPTSIDTVRWQPPAKRETEEWVIGWTGTSSNLPSLCAIEEPLADFLSQHPGTRLLVVCNRRPLLKRISPAAWQFERWSVENEVRLTQRMDVGLMPLPDTDWSRGKCAFKMISYMAVGVPVVVTPIGANQDLLQKADVGLPAVSGSDWYEALRLLFHDRKRAATLGRGGRQLVEDAYSVSMNARLLAKIFAEVAGL